MAQTITLIAKNFVNLFYPLHCAVCKTALDPASQPGLCSFCRACIRRNPKPYCRSCGRSIGSGGELCAECRRRAFAFDRAWSSCLYEGALKKAIHLFKYGGRMALSGLLCGQMTDFIKDNREIAEGIDLVTFVPLYRGFVNYRAFNQSEVLSSAIAEEFAIPALKTLEKTARTRRQNELSRDERLTNLIGVFSACAAVGDLKILLVDDVMTTGSTLDECARALKAAGAAEVRCITLARGM